MYWILETFDDSDDADYLLNVTMMWLGKLSKQPWPIHLKRWWIRWLGKNPRNFYSEASK